MTLKIKNDVSLLPVTRIVNDLHHKFSDLNDNIKLRKVLQFLKSNLVLPICDYNDLGPDASVIVVNRGYKTEMIHRLHQTDEKSYQVNQILDYFPLFSVTTAHNVDVAVLATRFETSDDITKKVIDFILEHCDLNDTQIMQISSTLNSN